MTAVPDSAAKLAARLRKLREWRRRRNVAPRGKRAALTPKQRQAVRAKTAGRCHLCGGPLSPDWRADHVNAHSRGGAHDPDNFLPAHPACNAYRWNYSPQESLWHQRIGIWARLEMERGSRIGRDMLAAFHRHAEGVRKRGARTR